MHRWLFQLEGNDFDLKDLASAFPSGNLCIVAIGTEYFMTGPGLDPMLEHKEVHPIADSALAEYSAVLSLMEPAFVRPRIGATYLEKADGTRKGFHLGTSNIRLRGVLTSSGTGAVAGPGQSAASPLATIAQQTLAKAATDARLHTALLLVGDPPLSWPRMYRILEEIELALGKDIDKAGLASNADRKRFRRSSNSALIAGADSRHASSQASPPHNPMSLVEAQDWIRGVLRSALG